MYSISIATFQHQEYGKVSLLINCNLPTSRIWKGRSTYQLQPPNLMGMERGKAYIQYSIYCNLPTSKIWKVMLNYQLQPPNIKNMEIYVYLSIAISQPQGYGKVYCNLPKFEIIFEWLKIKKFSVRNAEKPGGDLDSSHKLSFYFYGHCLSLCYMLRPHSSLGTYQDSSQDTDKVSKKPKIGKLFI